MTDFRVLGWNLVTKGIMSYMQRSLDEGILLPKKRPKAAGTALPQPAHGGEGCPICAVHRQIGEGYLLLRGLAETAQAEGRIPQGIGGTIPLARRSFEQAQDTLTNIAAADVNLRLQAVTVQGELAGIISSLIGDVRPSELPAIADAAEQAWRDTYHLADQAFRRDEPDAASPLEDDPLLTWMRQVRSEGWSAEQAIEELQRVINTGPAVQEAV